MSFFRHRLLSFTLPGSFALLLGSSALAIACGGNIASSGNGDPRGGDSMQDAAPTGDADGGDGAPGEAADDAADAAFVGDASPLPATCPGAGGRIVSCDYPGHTGQRSPEVSAAQVEACGFSSCTAYCQAANADAGLGGAVSCTTEEGTAKMYCTCLSP